MKTISTFKNRLTLHLFFLSVMFLIISAPLMSQVKHVVNVSDFKFTPNELQISVGDTVEWQNTQGYHNVNGTTVTFPLNPESFGNSAGFNWTYTHVFNTIGIYDFHCDPHALGGMVGKIEVKESNGNDDKFKLTINFMGMTPHVDQVMWLEVVDKNSEKEVERKKQIVSTDFSIDVSGIEKDHSYFVNFYADHNGNGSYDTPPVDHAWQLELNDVMGDTILNFQHNTNFTDIVWENKFTVHFMNMTPHVGQTMKLAVTDKNTGMELSRVNTIVSVDFMVDIYGIENGSSYNVDFFADHNGNGAYDVPPTDHAWRMELNDVASDTMLNFTHNTSFTDIQWKNELAVHFMGMTPHVGQNLTLWIINRETGMVVDSVTTTAQTEFMINSRSILTGKSYNIDFYADHNGNGNYDAPPTDHAWRIKLDDVKSDTMLVFQHNTSFTDIHWISTATSELNSSFLKMYPNPAINWVFIEMDRISGPDLQVSIYDITGKLKYNALKPFNNKIELDIQYLSSGIYFIELKTIDEKGMFKLIKQ